MAESVGTATVPMDPTDPKSSYQDALAARREQLARLQAGDLALANWRTVVFAVAVGIGIGAWGFGAVSAAWLVLPGAVFLGLVIRHDRLDRERKRVERAIDYYQRGLRRIASEWHGEGIVRDDLVDSEHPYAVDLDLFGVGSLFDLVATTRTPAGVHRLAQWLAAAASPAEIRERQASIEELRPRTALREDLALLADGIAAEVHPDVLSRWGERAAFFRNPGSLRVVAWSLTVAALVAAALWPLTPFGPVPLLVVATLEAAVMRWLRGSVDGVTETIDNPQRELRVLAEIIRRIEQESAHSAMLKRELERLRAHHQPASAAIATLIGRVVWLDAMRNQFFYPVGFLLMWRLHFSLSIEGWRLENGGRIAAWLDALGEVEALAALSGFAFENPEAAFPEIVAGEVVYEAEGLGHPLLPRETVVTNDIAFSQAPRVFLVSGSNMSGKSTMLRTVGLNAVLALAGAPVRAREMRISPLAIGASIRTQDSLLGGKSRFYAEIVRLKQVLDIAHGDTPALFLLDEILHGTNSHDRRTGAAAILQGFLETDAIGMITTHDLALADAAAALAPAVRNVHFADELIEGELVFDYTLREGVVQRSNAIELMRAVGLRV